VRIGPPGLKPVACSHDGKREHPGCVNDLLGEVDLEVADDMGRPAGFGTLI
jgi:hypothetical protein